MSERDLNKDLLISKWKLANLGGEFAFNLEVFGDTLAAREGYRDIDGMEAIYLYLIRTHHWLPREVRAMTTDDLRLALHVEMQDWKLPANVLAVAREARAERG